MVRTARPGRRRRTLAGLTAAATGIGLAVAVAPAASAATYVEDFTDGAGIVSAYGMTSAGVVDGEFCVDVPESSGNPWDSAVQMKPVEILEGETYTLTFDAHATRDVTVGVQGGAGWPDVFQGSAAVTSTPTTFEIEATPEGWSTDDGVIDLQLGGKGAAFTLCLDDVRFSNGTELIPGGDFTDGDAGFWASSNLTIDATGGALCVDVPAGTSQPWDAIVGVNGLPIVEGGAYRLTFTATATGGAGQVRTLAQKDVDGDWNAALTENAILPEGTPVELSYQFEGVETYVDAEDNPIGQVVFQVGGAAAAWTLCLDDVSLFHGAALEPYQPDTGPRVRVNQVGYLTHGPKVATLVTEQTTPVAWTLRDGGTVVAEGSSTPRGVDPTAGLNVHTIDFSDVNTPAAALTLEADGETSHAFAIDDGDAYEQLRVDALSFFYPQRSGEEILGEVAGEDYARPAGHDGVAPNQGDTAVTCLPAGASVAGGQDLIDWYDGYTCDYTLDASGGWYDAGDHGKYVVNGGISVAQLLSIAERDLYARSADEDALADGTLRIPESDNGVPDVLDEARVELEWMLAMQVPAGEQYAGMVHHKLTDHAWTGLPLYPHNDAQQRYLHRPSTAATLNMAAVAAQGARLFAEHDAYFAEELLDAAETAYAAAVAEPALFAPNTNTHPNPGGGPYDDTEVEDEFYWAAAELFLTTGEDGYLADVEANAYHLGGAKDPFAGTGFDWRDVAAVARIDLATVPAVVPDRPAIRRSVVAAARELVALQDEQPFGQPYAGLDGRFEWGSNGKILNNIAVLGVAFDISGNPVFSHAAVEAMDYVLGRNALNLSYVTGYGDVYSQNQHSRWYAAAVNAAYPHPPVGTVSGGPNSDVPDPISGPLLSGCAPQLCYVDHIEAWGVNELTINWNSGLAYAASFVADQDDALVTAPFTDVPLTHGFLMEIQWLADSGITMGYGDGTFRPAVTVNRGAMAAFLYRAAGSPAFTAPATSPFPDLATTHSFYDEITWLAAQGITGGYADGTFKPNRTVTRGEMSAFLYRAAGSPAVDLPTTPSFSDVGTGHLFYRPIEWMAQVQVTVGYGDGTYRQARSVDRQSMAAFLQRYSYVPVAG